MALLTHALTPEDLTAQKDRLYASILLNEGVFDVAGDAFEVNEDTGSNLNVRIGSGTVGDKAVVEGDSTADQGSYVVVSEDATDTVTLSAGDNSDPRIDRVGILVQDDEADSSGQSEAILTVVEGTPASSPSAPAEPDNFLTLATVEVAAQASAITDSDITDERVEVSNRVGPMGVLAYGQRVDNRTNIGGTEVDLGASTLTQTIDVPANRRLRIEAAFRMQASAAEDRLVVRLYEDSTVLKSWVKRFRASGATDTEHGVIIASATPSAGSRTYKLAAQRITGAGEFALIASETDPAIILVEDIGLA